MGGVGGDCGVHVPAEITFWYPRDVLITNLATSRETDCTSTVLSTLEVKSMKYYVGKIIEVILKMINIKFCD